MEIAAVYENGTIRFTQFVQLKHDVVNVMVVVPDEEIASNSSQNQDALDDVKDQSIKQMIMSMRQIRGTKMNEVNHRLTDNALFIEGLRKSEKYGL